MSISEPSFNRDSEYVIKVFMPPTERRIKAFKVGRFEFPALKEKKRNGDRRRPLQWNKIRNPR